MAGRHLGHACSSPFSISVVLGIELVVKNPQQPDYTHLDTGYI